jgi:hypothetical protein
MSKGHPVAQCAFEPFREIDSSTGQKQRRQGIILRHWTGSKRQIKNGLS